MPKEAHVIVSQEPLKQRVLLPHRVRSKDACQSTLPEFHGRLFASRDQKRHGLAEVRFVPDEEYGFQTGRIEQIEQLGFASAGNEILRLLSRSHGDRLSYDTRSLDCANERAREYPVERHVIRAQKVADGLRLLSPEIREGPFAVTQGRFLDCIAVS